MSGGLGLKGELASLARFARRRDMLASLARFHTAYVYARFARERTHDENVVHLRAVFL